MTKKRIFPFLILIMILSFVACSSISNQTLPTPTPQAEEEQPDEDSEVVNQPSTPSSGEILFGSLAMLQSAYEQIYEQTLPSVVTITTLRTISSPEILIPSFPELPEPDFQQKSAGSGFVWDKEGHIITNNHVIEGAESIRVAFADGTSVSAEVVGADASSDLAVLKVDLPASQLKPIEVADSTKVKVGHIAIAIGNPFELDGTMTTGIISGIGRTLPVEYAGTSGLYYSIPDIIQTDAAINPGNSGGPLLDIEGRLIGITTAIESPIRANTGIGYVIPSIIVSKVVPILIEEGDYQQPWIGISGTDMVAELAEAMGLDPSQKGALVIDVTVGSPADEAGLIGSTVEAKVDGQSVRVGGDVITAVDGNPIYDFEDLIAYLARYALVGQTIELEVLRDGKTLEIPLTLAARPGEEREESGNLQPEELSSNAWLGIQAIDLTPEIAEAMGLNKKTTGALVLQVSANSPADEAGIRGSYKMIEIDGEQIPVGGDVITAVDNEKIEGSGDLVQKIRQYAPGDKVKLSIIRDEKSMELTITLGERPSN